MESFRKEDAEYITEQEFNALYKPGTMPIFVDDLIYTMTGHHLNLPEMKNKIKIKDKTSEKFRNTYPTIPSNTTNPQMQDF